MNIRRFQQVKEENGFVASYTHMAVKSVFWLTLRQML